MLGETRTTKYRPPAVGIKRKSQWFHWSAASVFVLSFSYISWVELWRRWGALQYWMVITLYLGCPETVFHIDFKQLDKTYLMLWIWNKTVNAFLKRYNLCNFFFFLLHNKVVGKTEERRTLGHATANGPGSWADMNVWIIGEMSPWLCCLKFPSPMDCVSSGWRHLWTCTVCV